jgi:hypothetical protein
MSAGTHADTRLHNSQVPACQSSAPHRLTGSAILPRESCPNGDRVGCPFIEVIIGQGSASIRTAPHTRQV